MITIIATPNDEDLKKVELTIRTTMTIAEWQTVMEAIDKGKNGYFGPAYNLLKEYETIMRRYRDRIEAETAKPGHH